MMRKQNPLKKKANAGIYFVLKKENESFTDCIQRSKRTAARCGIGRKMFSTASILQLVYFKSISSSSCVM